MVQVRCEPKGDGWICEVDVEHVKQRTHHTVMVSHADFDRWGRTDVDDLVTRSFDFLLQREPPSSILRRFDLSVIRRYFPDYDREFSVG